MANRFETAAARIASRMQERASSSVVYHRGAFDITIDAVIGQTVFTFIDASGADQRIQSRDFFVVASDIAQLGEPERGDMIIETEGTQERVYEVMAPNSEPHWQWSDQFNDVMRVHTKFIRNRTVS